MNDLCPEGKIYPGRVKGGLVATLTFGNTLGVYPAPGVLGQSQINLGWTWIYSIASVPL